METEVCFRPVLFTPPPLPALGLELELWGPMQKGSPGLLLRATCASLACSSHLVTTPFPKCSRLLSAPWCVSHQISLSPREPPHRENHAEQDGSPAKGREEPSGWDRRGLCTWLLPLAGSEAGSLSVSVCLSVCHCPSCYCTCHLEATGIWPPRLLTCGLKGGTGGRGVRVECGALGTEGVGNESCWCQTTCLLCPYVWAVGSASSICQRGHLDQAGPVKFFFVLVPCPSLCLCPLNRDPGTDSLL